MGGLFTSYITLVYCRDCKWTRLCCEYIYLNYWDLRLLWCTAEAYAFLLILFYNFGYFSSFWGDDDKKNRKKKKKDLDGIFFGQL